MFSWLKYRSNFISRRVRKQNMEWSKGVIFLIATFWPEGLCRAELWRKVLSAFRKVAHCETTQRRLTRRIKRLKVTTYQTTPYAPSPTTS
jgi:hypothetical protein